MSEAAERSHLGGIMAEAVDRMLAAATSPAHVIDELSLATGIVIGCCIKPEHVDRALATADRATRLGARTQLALTRPGVQRQ